MECLRNAQNVEELEVDLAIASLHHRTDAPKFVYEEWKRLQPEVENCGRFKWSRGGLCKAQNLDAFKHTVSV